jgi:penicillin amidase
VIRMIRAKCPNGVRLWRDEHGVPHLQAPTLRGIYWAMGYCHALDRGLQLCMMRTLGQGRLSELIDASDASLEIDLFFRRMNWSGNMQEQLASLDAKTLELCQLYADGVNDRLKSSWPLELRLTGYKPEPWTIEDSLLTTRMVGYLTLAQSQGEVERLYAEMVLANVPVELLDALFPAGRGFDRSLLDGVTVPDRIVPEALHWMCAAPRAMASNNWVVAGSLTSSGSPMLANDPHLEVNRLPNVWCEQVAHLPDNYAVLFTMPGIPAPLVGRTRHAAWGATYTFMDGVDSWVEDCRDGQRRVGDDWKDFDVRVEIIRRKGKPEVRHNFYECEHGVLDGDPTVAGRYLCTRWAPAESGSASLNGARKLWSARTVLEIRELLGALETSWNWVIADRTGHIGYQMSGLLPIRKEGWNGFVPAPGWDASYDWAGFVPLDQLPRAHDPEEGYLVTANNDLNHLGRVEAINMPMGDYRARRIAEQLLASTRHDLDSFRAIHMDTHSIQADAFLRVLLPLVEGPAADSLAAWSGAYDPDMVEPSLFEAFYHALYYEIFEKVVGPEIAEHLLDHTGIFIDFYQDVDRLLLNPDSPWLAGRSQDEVFRSAFARVSNKTWPRWGAKNTVTLSHILLGGKLPAFMGFDRGPIELRGGRASPHQGQVYKSGGRQTSFAPSVRLVTDMATDHMHTAMAGGPSDRCFSKWYCSGLQDWLDGRYKRMDASETP